MSIENQNTPAATEAAITSATNKLIQASCLKHGITVDQIPPDAIEDARRTAREMVESDQRKQSNEYFHLYEQQKAEAEAL